MDIYLVKKKKNRTYASEDMVFALSGKKLSHGEKGEPLVDEGFVSVTDTDHYWACAFSDSPVGIDMEELARHVSENALRRLHPAEREYLAPLSYGSSEWKEEFLGIWTRKESYAKYLGKGLSLGFTGFCVLEGWQDTLETGLFGKTYKGLVFGATEEFEIKERRYDAPMKKTALEAGADMLDVRGYSAAALKKKLLSKGYGEEETEKAAQRLLSGGYLNDEEYARSLGEKYALRGYSSRRIEYELRKKGVGAEDAAKEAQRFREGDAERAEGIASKMAGGEAADDRLKAKIVRKLSSLGYDTNIVYDILHRLD